MTISAVLGRGEGCKARRVSEYLESACAGERSRGQGWRKTSENYWMWEWWLEKGFITAAAIFKDMCVIAFADTELPVMVIVSRDDAVHRSIRA